MGLLEVRRAGSCGAARGSHCWAASGPPVASCCSRRARWRGLAPLRVTHLHHLQQLAEQLPHRAHVRVQHQDHLAGRRRHLARVQLLEAVVERACLCVHLAWRGPQRAAAAGSARRASSTLDAGKQGSEPPAEKECRPPQRSGRTLHFLAPSHVHHLGPQARADVLLLRVAAVVAHIDHAGGVVGQVRRQQRLQRGHQHLARLLVHPHQHAHVKPAGPRGRGCHQPCTALRAPMLSAALKPQPPVSQQQAGGIRHRQGRPHLQRGPETPPGLLLLAGARP